MESPGEKLSGAATFKPSLLGVQHSISAIAATAPLIVETDTHNVVGEAAACIYQGSQPWRSDCALGLAEVHVEVFEFGRPASTDRAFDAGARGPSGLHVLEIQGGRLGAAADDGVFFDFAVCDAERSVKQSIGRPQNAQAGTRGAEPRKLVVGAQERSGNACGDLQDIATLLPRSLNVG